MLVVVKAPRYSKLATGATIIASGVAFGMCGWAAQAGGKIAHEEFRDAAAQVVSEVGNGQGGMDGEGQEATAPGDAVS